MASTMGSTVIRYTIDVPENEKKFSEPSRALPAGMSSSGWLYSNGYLMSVL